MKEQEKAIENGLMDKNWKVRKRFAEMENLNPTPNQIARGLKDDRWEVRAAFASRNVQFTKQQIKDGLDDNDWRVRYAFAKNKSYVPTKDQIENGLSDRSLSVSLAFVHRSDIKLTKEQVERGMKGDYTPIQDMYKRASGECDMADKERHINTWFNSQYSQEEGDVAYLLDQAQEKRPCSSIK